MCVFVRYAARVMDQALSEGEDLDSRRSLQALVAGLKAYSTWGNLACLQECRECTGGMVCVCVCVFVSDREMSLYTVCMST